MAKIVVYESDPTSQEPWKSFFIPVLEEDYNHQVFLVATNTQDLQTFIDEDRPDILIIGLRFPWNEREVIAYIKERYPQIKIIAMSQAIEGREIAKEIGILFLRKPLIWEDTLELIENVSEGTLPKG